MNTDRIKKLQKSLKHPILIKKKENLFYLTGEVFDHRADEYLLVTKKTTVAFGSGLEKITWAKKVDRLKNFAKYIPAHSPLDIGYDFTYGEGEYIKSKVKSAKCKVRAVRSVVDEMRQIKDAGELAKIRQSMQIVERVFRLVRKEIKKSGMTEIKLAKFIEASGLAMGAEDVSFPAIVASGVNAAIPHHVPGSKKLKAGESIILDFGFKYKHYCSDFTRTVFLKFASKKLAEAYNQVESAYIECLSLRGSASDRSNLLLAKRLPRPSDAFGARNDSVVSGDDLYQKSVDVLAEKKLDKYFIHSLGHGTGLEIHELPNLSPKSKDILQNGMVFSIEPGVYFPKLGGIRIEDLVSVKNAAAVKFIYVPTDLISNIL